MWETQVEQFQDKFGLPSLKLNLPEGVGEGELFVNNKSLTTAELNGESPCLLSTVEAEKIIPKIEEVSEFPRHLLIWAHYRIILGILSA